MPSIARIENVSHPKHGHWAIIVRSGSGSGVNSFVHILDGSAAGDCEGVAIPASDLGTCYAISPYKVDLKNGRFNSYPVKIYGPRDGGNPGGEYLIHSQVDTAHPVGMGSGSATATLTKGSSTSPTRSSTAVLDPPKTVPKTVPIAVASKPLLQPLKLPMPSLDGLPVKNGAEMPIITVDEMAYYLENSRIEQTVMFWGPPGVGKSAGVQEYAARRNAKLHTVLLSMVDPTSLKGIGVADMAAKKMVWLPDESIPTESNSILFLDEITAAPQLIQALAYQITWDRAIGNRPLPPDCRVIMAGNRTTDRGVAFHMPSPLSNRCVHLNVEADIISWRKWAYSAGIDPRLIAFLSLNSDRRDPNKNMLHRLDPSRSGGPWPSPRSWSNASEYLSSGLTPRRMGVAIAGCVGVEEARAFIKFCLDSDKYAPRVFDILNGVKSEMRREVAPAVATTIACAVVANAVEDPPIIRNALSWASYQDGEFAAIVERGLGDRFGPDLMNEITGGAGPANSIKF